MNVLDVENWAEIFSTIKKNKLRTFLTGFSISWGIFMFCILLSAGNGLRNGMLSNFEGRAVNRVNFWGDRTSIPYKGFPDNRNIHIDDKDVNLIRTQVPEAGYIAPRVYSSVTASFGTLSTSCQFMGANSEFTHINHIKILDNQGRFINDIDMKESRKVAVINKQMRTQLFKDENPVGKIFIAGGLSYTVIGVYDEESWGSRSQAYIPITTAQRLYNKGWGFNNVMFTLNDLETNDENVAFEKRLREKLADLHIFDSEDNRAIGMWNALKNYLQFIGMFNGISAFIWIIGVGTLIAGIIGVSNIMLITVRERTREIGIRKALGAQPSSILGSILLESIFITSIFGYAGMFLGVGLGELVNSVLQSPGMPEELSYIVKNPTIEVPIAIGAMIVLIVSGLFAGYFPAWKAVKIPPVEAMRAE
ncbi:MAG: ABC transporter permease [Dysgonamonadaceae bacterium]|jgi:putative ABC transport system permease protein|nr:ABC transporter permease [Dysgonamonadaceae bacterium]